MSTASDWTAGVAAIRSAGGFEHATTTAAVARHPMNAERRTSNGSVTVTTPLKPRDVGKSGRYGADLFEAIEQHGGRVPLAADERITEGRRQRGRNPEVAGHHRAGVDVCVDRDRRIPLARRLHRVHERMIGCEARHAQDRRVAKEDLGELLADDRL